MPSTHIWLQIIALKMTGIRRTLGLKATCGSVAVNPFGVRYPLSSLASKNSEMHFGDND